MPINGLVVPFPKFITYIYDTNVSYVFQKVFWKSVSINYLYYKKTKTLTCSDSYKGVLNNLFHVISVAKMKKV